MSQPVLLYGAPVAQQMLTRVQTTITTQHLSIQIGAILVGELSASLAYIKKKQEAAHEVGITFHLKHFPETVTEQELVETIKAWNADPLMTGYIIQLPLPAHISPVLFEHIIPSKDIDGFHPLNIGHMFLGNSPDQHLPSATPKAVMALLNYYQIPLVGKHVVIVGKSNIVGKPLAVHLLNEDATVTVCHKDTLDLARHTREADILISATGVGHLIKRGHIKQGAVTIDVGFSRVGGKLIGDIDFQDIAHLVSAHAPVPGGLGPITVASLMDNALLAYFLQHHAA